jgi:hypothetical protein
MKESNRNQIQGVRLPPSWCSFLCRNAMNERCIEDCAPNRNCSGFELKPGINLIDMPRFPSEQIGQMTKEEKLTAVTVYIAKTVDHLKGIERQEHNLPLPQALPKEKVRETIKDVASGLAESVKSMESDDNEHE